FYDPKAREIADKIAVDEWFAGAQESREYRKLAIGGLMGDVVERMVHTAAHNGWRPMAAASSTAESPAVKLALSGCHDTTLASILASVGAFEGEKWPPYTSSIAVELFKHAPRSTKDTSVSPAGEILEEFSGPPAQKSASDKPSFFSFLSSKKQTGSSSSGLARVPQATHPALSNHYVRIRYNDQPVTIPSCAASPANHLRGDKTFCTLEAFKEMVDKFTPSNWREECGMNLDKGMFPEGEQKAAGY
ncbi:hypothetical protein FQN49_005897, partial [Arthroderma sp. PD_2]